MDKANFKITVGFHDIVMRDGNLFTDGSLSDPEYLEYELAVRVAELEEENKKLKESKRHTGKKSKN